MLRSLSLAMTEGKQDDAETKLLVKQASLQRQVAQGYLRDWHGYAVTVQKIRTQLQTLQECDPEPWAKAGPPPLKERKGNWLKRAALWLHGEMRQPFTGYQLLIYITMVQMAHLWISHT